MQEERPDDNFSQGGGEEEEEEEKDNNDNEDCDEASMERTTSNALAEFRDRVEFAILGNYLIPKENNGRDEDDSKVIKLWGVPLLPSVGHAGTDTILIKFLKAKRYDVHKAFNLLQGALKWRAEFWPDDKDHGSEEDSTVWFTDGRDTEGCPVCYTVLGRESRRRFMSTGDHSRYQDYLRWRIQCVEKGIQSLDFSPGGVDSFIQIIDLKNAPGITNREIKLIFILMDAAHPERPIMVFGSQHIEPTIHCTKKQEQIHLCQVLESDRNPSQVTIFISLDKHLCPVQYGGLKRENDTEFSTADKVLEAWIRTSATEQIKIPWDSLPLRLLPPRKAWKVFANKFQIKLHRLKRSNSKAVNKLTHSEPYKPRNKHRWPYHLSIQPKRFKQKHKSRTPIHRVHRRTPSVYVDQLFIEPASVVSASRCKEKSNSNPKVDQPAESSEGDRRSGDAADELWESVVLNSPQMKGINERAEEFIARFRAQMHHQEMAARRLL